MQAERVAERPFVLFNEGNKGFAFCPLRADIESLTDFWFPDLIAYSRFAVILNGGKKWCALYKRYTFLFIGVFAIKATIAQRELYVLCIKGQRGT